MPGGNGTGRVVTLDLAGCAIPASIAVKRRDATIRSGGQQAGLERPAYNHIAAPRLSHEQRAELFGANCIDTAQDDTHFSKQRHRSGLAPPTALPNTLSCGIHVGGRISNGGIRVSTGSPSSLI